MCRQRGEKQSSTPVWWSVYVQQAAGRAPLPQTAAAKTLRASMVTSASQTAQPAAMLLAAKRVLSRYLPFPFACLLPHAMLPYGNTAQTA